MILVDSSAWVEFLRGTNSGVHERLRKLITTKSQSLVTTEPVHLELLAGARTTAELATLRRLLGTYELVPLEGLTDYESAAAIYRTCRGYGETVRARPGCLIAAVAIRVDAEVLHRDRDFEAIARHTSLRLAS